MCIIQYKINHHHCQYETNAKSGVISAWNSNADNTDKVRLKVRCSYADFGCEETVSEASVCTGSFLVVGPLTATVGCCSCCS